MSMIHIQANSVINSNDRSVITYEILDLTIDNNNINFRGWGLLQNKHHFNYQSKHEYYLELNGKNHKLRYKGNNRAVNLNEIMHYRGYRRCSNSSLNARNCNYDFNYVGFEFKVPLKDLRTSESYTASLSIKSKQLNKEYKTKLYYPKDHVVQKQHLDRNIVLESSYQTVELEAFYHTLVARSKASPKSEPLYIGPSCSAAYTNIAFFRQGSRYKNIQEVDKYRGLVTYFKVKVRQSTCVNQRRRIVEGNQAIAYIPSTYVNYHGDPLKINVKQILHKPEIIAKDIQIKQYSKYNPYKYAKAIDKKDKDISDKISIYYNTVDTMIPDKYKTCYTVKNSLKQSANKCINVEVIKADTYFRYVNNKTVNRMIDQSFLWSNLRIKLYNILQAKR